MREFIGLSEWETPEGVSAVQVHSSAYYALQEPDGGINQETQLLCVLHGWGQNSRSFLRRFTPLKAHNVLVVAPQGPHQMYLDMETRKVGFSWLTTYDRNRAVADLFELMDSVLAKVRVDGGITAAPYLLGFSQGVSIAYRYHLLGGRPAAGIIACGGDLPSDVRTAVGEAPSLPTLLIHGKRDGIVPLAKGEEAASILRDAGHQPECYYFDGEHVIPPEAVEKIAAWITKNRDA